MSLSTRSESFLEFFDSFTFWYSFPGINQCIHDIINLFFGLFSLGSDSKPWGIDWAGRGSDSGGE